MCGNARIGKGAAGALNPGSHLISHGRNGALDYKQWGVGTGCKTFSNSFGGQYNARIERLNDLYRSWDRVYVEFTSFYEGGAEFYYSLDSIMKIAALQNENGILVLTRSSEGTPVKPYHSRTAIVLSDGLAFTNHNKVVEIDYSFLKIA